MNDDLKKLYDAVSSTLDIGTFESFSSKMQSEEERKRFYDAIAKNGLDLGDYKEYESRLKKKDQTGPLLDGDGVTSDVEGGGLDSSQIEQTEPSYLLDENPIGRGEIINLINDPNFDLSRVKITNDIEVVKLLEEAHYKHAESQKSTQEREEVTNEETVVDNIFDTVDTSRQVNTDSLTDIRERYNENTNFNFNNTLTHSKVNTGALPAMDALVNLWKGSPLNLESAFRDKGLNESVNGEIHSLHLHGLAVDFTGESAKELLEWINNTEEGKAWAEEYTEGASGGVGVELEFEGEQKEHLHIQFKREFGRNQSGEEVIKLNYLTTNPETITPEVLGSGHNITSSTIEDVSNLYPNKEEYKERAKLSMPRTDTFKELGGSITKLGNEFFTESEIEAQAKALDYTTVSLMNDHNKRAETFLKKEKEIKAREEEVINNYLNNGWEHLGGGKYKHAESNVILTPDMTGGSNPLLAGNSIYPIIIQRIKENPDYFANLDSEKIDALYAEFNPIDNNFNQAAIDAINPEGTFLGLQIGSGDTRRKRKEIKEVEFKLKKSNFIKNIVLQLAEGGQKNLESEDLINEAKRLGVLQLEAEGWLEKQTSLINAFPKNNFGKVDAINMSEEDIKKYNSLVEVYNNYFNNEYQAFVEEQKKFQNLPEIKNFHNLTNSYNNIANYQSSLKGGTVTKNGETYPVVGNVTYTIHMENLQKKQAIMDKFYNESTLGSILLGTTALLSDAGWGIAEQVASIPRYIKGVFSYENNYDYTDRIAQYITDAKDQQQQCQSLWGKFIT